MAGPVRERLASGWSGFLELRFMKPRSNKRRSRSPAGKLAMQLWREARTRCQLCHRPADRNLGDSRYWNAHRIIKGKAYDPRNVLFLCGSFQDTRCHDLFESHRIRTVYGELLPHLELEHALWLKQDDPFDKYDPAYLQELRGKSPLPEPLELPAEIYTLREISGACDASA